MAKQTFCLLFQMKKSKVSKTGEAPLQMRLTINGQRTDIYLSIKADPKNWNQKKEKMMGSNALALEVNNYIESVRVRIYEIKRELEDAGRPLDPLTIKDMFNGVKSKANNCHMFCEEFQIEIDRMEALVGVGEIKMITVRRYKLCLKYFKQMYAKESKLADLPIQDVNNAMIIRFGTFLKVERKLCQNTVIRFMKCFKKIINIALNNGWIKANPFFGIKYKETPVHKDTLTRSEVMKIYEKEFGIERIDRCRDIFVFCCLTGLAFIDVFSLTAEDIHSAENNVLWIQKDRVKTQIETDVPLAKIPLAILKKYKDHPKCLKTGKVLPVDSNQKMNSYLKEIADFCGINKKLTTHTARHTFATLMIGSGAALKNVSTMMGHASTRMTERYVGKRPDALIRDMQVLTDGFERLQ